MNPNLVIRTSNSSDINIILALHKSAMEVIGAYKGDGPWDDDLKDIENHYNKNFGVFLVGILKEQIVTMGAIRRIDPLTAEVKRMRTFPEYQGRGYGTLILKHLISFAQDHGYKRLILETSDKQINAINLYKNMGFSEFKKENIDGFNCTWFRMNLTKS